MKKKIFLLILPLILFSSCGKCPVCPEIPKYKEPTVMPLQTWYEIDYRAYDPDLGLSVRSAQSVVSPIGGRYIGLFFIANRNGAIQLWDLVSKENLWSDTAASPYYAYTSSASYLYMESRMYFFRIGSGGLSLSSYDATSGSVTNHATHVLGYTTSSTDLPWGSIYCDSIRRKVFYAWARLRTATSNAETVYVRQYDLATGLDSEITSFSGTDFYPISIGSDGTYLYIGLREGTGTGKKITIADGTTASLTLGSNVGSVGYQGFNLDISIASVVLYNPAHDVSWTLASNPISSREGAVLIDDTGGYPYKAILHYIANVNGVATPALRILSLNEDESVTVHLSITNEGLYGGYVYSMVAPMFGTPGGFSNQMLIGSPYATGFQLNFGRTSVE